jgi:hypothetical protein
VKPGQILDALLEASADLGDFLGPAEARTPSNFLSSNYFQFNDPNNCHNLPTLIAGIHVETGSFSLDLINLLSGFYNNST